MDNEERRKTERVHLAPSPLIFSLTFSLMFFSLWDSEIWACLCGLCSLIFILVCAWWWGGRLRFCPPNCKSFRHVPHRLYSVGCTVSNFFIFVRRDGNTILLSWPVVILCLPIQHMTHLTWRLPTPNARTRTVQRQSCGTAPPTPPTPCFSLFRHSSDSEFTAQFTKTMLLPFPPPPQY